MDPVTGMDRMISVSVNGTKPPKFEEIMRKAAELDALYEAMTPDERIMYRAKVRCELYNELPGRLADYDCPECLNRGDYMALDECGKPRIYQCRCLRQRDTMKHIRMSGLGDAVQKYRFDNFDTDTEWRSEIKNKTLDYVENHGIKWLVLMGQSGSGKSHLGTATSAEIMRRECVDMRYVVWTEESKELVATVNDRDSYQQLIKPMKDASILYIDDFLKSKDGKMPTDGEVRAAIELINRRYFENKTATILSSEFYIEDLMNIDQSMAGRIFEMTGVNGEYHIPIQRDVKKNFRFFGKKRTT